MLVGGRVAVHIHAAQSRKGEMASMAALVGRTAEQSRAALNRRGRFFKGDGSYLTISAM